MRTRPARAPNLLVLILLGLLGCVARADATEWFVAPGGTGSGTSAAPFGRIQDGLTVALPGDTVTVRPGTYTESISTMRNPVAGNPITVRAETPRTVIVTKSGNVLSVAHAYHVLDGLVIDGQYGADRAVKVTSTAASVVLRNLEVRHSGRDCVSIGSPSHLLIENSLIHHCLNPTGGRSDAHGISAAAARSMMVRGTEIHTFSGDGIQIDPARSVPGWDELTIDGCRIWLAPLAQSENGFAAGIVPGENAVDTKVSSSAARARLRIQNTQAWGFRGGLVPNMAAFNLKENLDATVDRVTVWNSEIGFRLRGPAWVRVQNAVIHHVDYGIRYEDNIQALHVWNTTFGVGVPRPFYAASSSSAGLQVRNVLVLASNLPAEAATDSSNRAVSAASFVSAGSNDYRLTASSPAIDTGIWIPEVQADRDGVVRPQRVSYDIGAHEYVEISRAPVPPTNLRVVTAPLRQGHSRAHCAAQGRWCRWSVAIGPRGPVAGSCERTIEGPLRVGAYPWRPHSVRPGAFGPGRATGVDTRQIIGAAAGSWETFALADSSTAPG